MTVDDLVAHLQLEPLPGEGGYYRETYRSHTRHGPGGKAHGTAIYFLITPEQFSALHRLPADEIWHFYLGDPVEQLRIQDTGVVQRILLGSDITAHPPQHPQTAVPVGVWQGTRLLAGGRYALLGTTMAPGFDFEDLEMANRTDLAQRFPDQADLIHHYTREHA